MLYLFQGILETYKTYKEYREVPHTLSSVSSSDYEQNDSITHVYMSILFQILFPFRLFTEYWAQFPVLYSRSLLEIY